MSSETSFYLYVVISIFHPFYFQVLVKATKSINELPLEEQSEMCAIQTLLKLHRINQMSTVEFH